MTRSKWTIALDGYNLPDKKKSTLSKFFDVDMKITASIASGNTYGDRTASGKSVGGGVQKYFRDTGFGYRFEANLVDIDNVVTTNGVTTGSTASGGTNTVTISGMQGANAKVALTYTLGREGN